MQEFARIIAASEDWLRERVLAYALERGYTRYTCTLKEDWRLSISGLSDALLKALPGTLASMELGPEDRFENDPASAFAVKEARLHRTRGISLPMFLGLLKYYRQSYLDLVAAADLAEEERASARAFAERFFDRVEVGIASEWCAIPESNRLDELRETSRTLANEKNRYRTLFESLAAPAVFIGINGRVLDLNMAAAAWLEQTSAPSSGNSRSRTAGSAGSAGMADSCGRMAAELFPWVQEPLERVLKGSEPRLVFEQRIGQGESAREIIATLSTNQGCCGDSPGVVLIMQDVSELTRSKELLHEANRKLESEVRARTRILKETNDSLQREVRDRELYQQALAESAALYRAVAEDQGELICRFRADGSPLFANNAYTRVFGTAMMARDRQAETFTQDGRTLSLDALLDQAANNREAVSFEQQSVTPTGQKVWFRWTCRGVPDERGALAVYQFVGQDVTRAREAELALQALNEALESTVRQRTDELEERARSLESLSRNLQTQIESRRRAEAALAKAAEEQQAKVRQISALYGLAEVLGSHWASVEAMLGKAVNAIVQGWRTQNTISGAIEFDDLTCHAPGYAPDCGCLRRPLSVFGHERGSVAVCNVGPCETPDKPFAEDEEALLSSMARQLERSLEAFLSHEQLSRSEREFREFFDNAAEAIFIHDESGLILDANKNASIWLNLSMENLVGMNLTDFAAAEDREGMTGRFMNALREAPEVFHITLRRKDDFAIPLELLCQAQGYKGRTVLISSGRNIAKRLKSEAESRRRMLQEQLLSKISSRLVNAIAGDVPRAMTETLGDICGFVGMQRAAVYEFDPEGKRFVLAHQWHAQALAPMPRTLKTLGRGKAPWLFECSLTQKWLTIRDVAHLPPAAIKEKLLLSEAGIGCLTAIPMTIRDRLQGLFVVACRSQETPTQPGPDPQLLLQFAPLFSNVMLRQRSREALRESANLTTSILNALSSFLCVIDKHGVISMLNRAWMQSASLNGPAVAVKLGVGDDYLAFLNAAAEDGDEQARDMVAGIGSVLTGGLPLFRMEFSSRSGPALHWFLLEATPRGKGTRGAVLTHLNITARKRAEQRLARNENRYRTLIEALHEGLLMVRKGGVMAYINDQFAKMLGWPKATLLGRKPEEYVAAESLARLNGLLTFTRESRHAEEIIWNHASGRHVYTLVTPSSILDENGVVSGTFAVITDTTERKGLESQLLQSQKLEAIGQLAAGIAHEINTPAQYVGNNVQFIKGAFEDLLGVCAKAKEMVLASKQGGPACADVAALEAAMVERDVEYLEAEMPRAIAQTIEGVERISTIVRSVKQFAHPGAAVMAPADLNEAMRSTVTVSRNEWKYVADLDTELDTNLPPVICMIGEINQVVLNLIVNAAHAIADAIKDVPDGRGRITLATRHAPPWAEVRVTDTGTGIPPAVQAKIFDPFFTTKEVGKGTGQGLTIARTIVMEKHHGQLFFETEPGKGTTFVVRLPLEQPEGGGE